MAFVSGPRQAGKTTTCRLRAGAYVNRDGIDDRELVLAGAVEASEFERLGSIRFSPSHVSSL